MVPYRVSKFLATPLAQTTIMQNDMSNGVMPKEVDPTMPATWYTHAEFFIPEAMLWITVLRR